MNDESESNAGGSATLEEEDYYAILNVARDATDSDITKAFRELSRLYHPDKHVDPELKKDADKLFTKTKKAYDVLRDPHKRAIYDTTGVRGLETEGWEVAQRTKTPQEIREEFERLARLKKELTLDLQTKPKGSVFVHINATDLFGDYGNDTDSPMEMWDLLSSIEVSSMGFTQSVEAPMTQRDTLKMAGRLTTRNGAGSGSVSVALQRTLQTNGVIEGTLNVGEGPSMSVRYYRGFGPRLSFVVLPNVHFTPRGIEFGLVTVLLSEFDEHTTGSLTWNCNSSAPSMNASVTFHYTRVRVVLSAEVGIPHSYIGVSSAINLPHGLLLRTMLRVGTYGGSIEYGVDKTVSERSVVGASVSVGVPTGVSLKLKVVRGRQTYSFPIHLCHEVIPAPVFYATVVPLVVWKLTKKFLIDPIELEEKKRKTRETRERNKKRMEEARQDAEMAKNLMQAQFERIHSQEEGRSGLVILKALYGRLVSNTSDDSVNRNSVENSENGIIDVTVPLQCLVRDSKLILHNGPKSHLVGLYDPCVGEEKQLLVHYKFNNAEHEVTIPDDGVLRIPLPASLKKDTYLSDCWIAQALTLSTSSNYRNLLSSLCY